MIPYFSDVIFNTRRLASKEATTLQDTTTLTQIKSSEYALLSEISSLLILVCFITSTYLLTLFIQDKSYIFVFKSIVRFNSFAFVSNSSKEMTRPKRNSS